MTGLIIRNTDGNQVVFSRDGDGWLMPEAGDYPVQKDIVVAVLDKLVNIGADRFRPSGMNSRN